MPAIAYKIVVAILWLHFFCPQSSSAQDFVYRHYGLRDGLPNTTIHAIFQDKEGFMWFGAESGLCRFDGHRFRTFTVKDGLPGTEVLGFYQDTQGRMWLQFYKNTVAYIYKGKIHSPDNDSLLARIQLLGRVYSISEDGEGNIGLCGKYALTVISRNGDAIKTFTHENGTPLHTTAMVTGHDGRFLVGMNNGICRLEGDRLVRIKTYRVKGDGLAQVETLLHKNYATHIWTDSVFLKDTLVFLKNIPFDRAIKYSPVCDSIFSVNTVDGCYLYYINQFRTVKILPGVKVSNVYMDIENNLWIGTIGEGLYRMCSQEIINNKVSENQNEIVYVTRHDGRLIVGNNGAYTYEYRNGKFEKLYDPPKRSVNTRVLRYEKLTNNRYLVVNGGATLIYRDGKLLKDDFLQTAKHATRYDDQHLLLSLEHGVVRIRMDDLKKVDTISNKKTLCSFKVGDSILIGTLSGMYIARKINEKYQVVDSMLNKWMIWSIDQTTDKTIWVCTYENGLYGIRNGKVVHHITTQSGLPGDNCRALFTKGDTIWCGTDQGLVKIIPENGRYRFKKFTTADGLPSNAINCIYVDGATVYLGTPEGLCHFDETRIETNSICNLVLSEARIGDSVVSIADSYTLRGNTPFALAFSGISFRSEQETIFRYRIHDIDATWRTTNTGLLEFASLPYGRYQLEIIAVNKFGKESKPLKIWLNVKKPFHKTYLFLLLAVLLPAAILWYAYNRRVQLVRRRQVQKLQQEVKMIRLEQMALRAQMNPHFIFNCINVLQQLIAEKDTANTHRFISSFSGLVRQTLDNAPEMFIPLQEEIKFLTNYLELERIRLEDSFSYTIDTPSIRDVNQWTVPNMVIQPFVENAIRHGIRYKKNGRGTVEVRFAQNGNGLRCTITDDGIGREKAAKLRKESGIHHSPKGIGITFKRIESLNNLINDMVAITIEDLKDEQQQACGTRVIIDFYKNAAGAVRL